MELIGQLSQEAIDALKLKVKNQYGENHKVFAYKVDGKVCYLRSVDRDTYSIAAAKASGGATKFNEAIIERIWLGGEDSIRREDGHYFGLVEFVEELMNKKKGELGEL